MVETSVGQSIEGILGIRLRVADGRVNEVTISSSRPVGMTQVFVGKTPAEVISLLPLLYSVCGVAQGFAAATALERAQSAPCFERVNIARSLLVDFEAVREHLWRIELDWAKYLDRPPKHQSVFLVGRLMRSFRQTLFEDQDPFSSLDAHSIATAGDPGRPLEALGNILQQHVFSSPPRSWAEMADEESLQDWIRYNDSVAAVMLANIQGEEFCELGRCQVEVLPKIQEPLIEDRLHGDQGEFVASPDWQGEARETGPLARQVNHPLMQTLHRRWGNGLLPRLVARLLDLAFLYGRLERGVRKLEVERDGVIVPEEPGGGVGLALVDASRGLLIHRVRLDQGRVEHYQIVAPTEWNFHPLGIVSQGLVGIAADDRVELEKRARLLISAVDPCVSYELFVEPADL